MARSGQVTLVSGTDTVVENAVLKQQAPVMTLGQLAAAALGGSDNPEVVTIDFATRDVVVYTTAPTVSGGTASGTFVQDDDKKVAPWTGSGSDTGATDVANAAVKPTRSLAALISALEDYGVANPNAIAMIKVDQNAPDVKIYPHGGTPTGFSGGTVAATFNQEPAASTGTIKNPFE